MEVNNELIEKEATKTKKTRRYPISPLFIKATKFKEDFLKWVKKVKIISISEMNLQFDTRPPLKLRTIHDHFYELSTNE